MVVAGEHPFPDGGSGRDCGRDYTYRHHARRRIHWRLTSVVWRNVEHPVGYLNAITAGEFTAHHGAHHFYVSDITRGNVEQVSML